MKQTLLRIGIRLGLAGFSRDYAIFSDGTQRGIERARRRIVTHLSAADPRRDREAVSGTLFRVGQHHRKRYQRSRPLVVEAAPVLAELQATAAAAMTHA